MRAIEVCLYNRSRDRWRPPNFRNNEKNESQAEPSPPPTDLASLEAELLKRIARLPVDEPSVN